MVYLMMVAEAVGRMRRGRRTTFLMSKNSLKVFLCVNQCQRLCPHVLGDSGGVVNSLDFCPASLKSLGCFYFRCYFLHNGRR